jgi:hypothetical protein
MYELAIRHAIRKPLVQICEKDTDLPFDINEQRKQRTIFYTNDMKGAVELKANFEAMVVRALEDIKVDNPIYRAIQNDIIIHSTEIGDPEKYLLKRMDELETNIMRLMKNPIKNPNYNDNIHMIPPKDKNKIIKIILEIINNNDKFSTVEVDNVLRENGISVDGEVLRELIKEALKINREPIKTS